MNAPLSVEWTAAAQGDLQSLHDFVALDNPRAAVAQVLRVMDAVEALLPTHPGLGRVGRVTGTRELVVPGTPYLVAYRVRGGALQVLRVLHGAMRWPEGI